MVRMGYTLIEIMVTLTIIGIIFGAGFVAFREYSRRQALSSVVREILGDLRLTQSEALAGKKPTDPACNSPSTLDGYYFEVLPPSLYKISAKCTGGMVVVKNVDVSPAVLTPPSQNPILFKVLGLGTNITASDTIVVDVFGMNQTILISGGGSFQ